MPEAHYLIEPDQLEAIHDNSNIVIVDCCKPGQYRQAHIPGALHIDYASMVKNEKPVMGLLPDDENFSGLLSSLGIHRRSLIVAYDDEGGGCAARFVWTLQVYGHETAVILNGGLHSWANEGHPLSNETPAAQLSSHYHVNKTHHHTASRAYIQTHLEDKNICLLDARSPAEYSGEKKLAERGGHIPGAINFEWTAAMNQQNNLRRLPADILQAQLDKRGITKDREIICYCQSHHRSAYSWLILKSLGYKNVLGYPGSWSEWGNRSDTLVEKGGDPVISPISA